MPISKEILSQFKSVNFVETGTHHGDGVQTALDVGFLNVYSIESERSKWKKARERFLSNPVVRIIHGDSGEKLEGVLSRVRGKCTVWLDAHYDSVEEVPKGMKGSPLLEELEILAKLSFREHILLIDDIRLFFQPGGWQGIIFSDIESFVLKINPQYCISYVNGHVPNDILVAEVLDVDS